MKRRRNSRNDFDVLASDADADVLSWSISGGTDATKFAINAATGELTLNSSDYENPTDADGNNTYEVELTVTDSGNLSASKPVTITVTDVNEAPADIQLSSATILENQPIGTIVGQLSATDPDGDALTFTHS